MNLNRRRLFTKKSLVFSLLGGSTPWFAGARANPLSSLPTDEGSLNHLLSRASFGMAPGDWQRAKQLGLTAWLQEQLNPQSIEQEPIYVAQLEALATITWPHWRLLEVYAERNSKTPRVFTDDSADLRLVRQQIRHARMLRAIGSRAQLQEVMTDFWFNHFNVFAQKGLTNVLTGAFEQEAIRPHTMGSFKDLLVATAKHPAMLIYLDNVDSSAKGLNENYARELMELHTMGAQSGYSQNDVTQLARVFTGWGINRKNPAQSAFVFNPARHDNGEKTWLGQMVQGKGADQGLWALDVLANHPATAQRIAFKLAQWFVNDEPDSGLVKRLAQRFADSNGHIASLLTGLFEDSAFWQPTARNTKFKTPFEFIVSALRSSGATVDDYQSVLAALQQQGQPLYGCLTPDGYKSTEVTWLTPEVINQRLNFANAIGQGRLRGVSSVRSNGDQLLQTLALSVSSRTREKISVAPPELRVALLLGSPDFMRR
jgi:uncharacterized protein (DUF1800 family)